MRRILGGLSASCAVACSRRGAYARTSRMPWQMTFQPAATDMMEQITWFEHYTLWFIVPITLLVLVLLAWCIMKFRASVNPTPSRTSHNTLIEVIWTVGPVVVLLFLAVPSFQLLTAQYKPPEEPKLTIKATGNQWNWDYEYQIEEPLSFNSAILADDDRAAAGKADLAVYPRLLAVDNELVVPVNTMIARAGHRLPTSSTPSPCRPSASRSTPCRAGSTRSGSRPRRKASIYGQCSELCGKDHAFMPIAIRVVSRRPVQAPGWRPPRPTCPAPTRR